MTSPDAPRTEDAPPKKKRPGRLRRVWKWTWRSAVVLLVAAWLLRNVLIGPWLLDRLEPLVAEALGAPVELDGISGSWLSDLGLKRVRTLEAATKTPLRALDVEELTVDWSLWGLVSGDPDWLKSVRAAGVSVELDPRQGAPAPEDEESAGGGLPEALPLVEVERLRVVYDDGEVRAAVPAGSLTAQREEVAEGAAEAPRTLYQLLVPALEFARDGEAAPTLAVALEAAYRGGRLDIPRLAVDEREHVRRAFVDLGRVTEGVLDYDLDLILLDGAVRAQGGLADGRIQAQLAAEGLQAEALEPWLDLGLRGRLEFEGEVDWPLDDPLAGVATMRFGAADNAWKRYQLDAIRGEVRLAEGWLSSEHLEAHGPDLELQARELRLPLFAEDDVQETSGFLDLRVDDLPGWLRRAELELPPEAGELHTLALRTRLVSTAEEVRVDLEELALTTGLGSLRAQGGTTLRDFRLMPDAPVALDLRWEGLELPEAAAKLAAYDRLSLAHAPESGRLQFDLQVTGTAAEPEAALSLGVRDLRPGDWSDEIPPGPYQAQLDLEYAHGRVAVAPFLLNGPHVELTVRAEKQIALDLAALAAGELPSLAGPVDGDIGLRVDPHRHLEGVALLKSEVRALLDPRGAPESLRVDLELASKALRVALPEGGPADDARVNGMLLTVGADLSGPRLLPTGLSLDAEFLGLTAGGLPEHSLRVQMTQVDQRLTIDGFDFAGDVLAMDLRGSVPLDLAAPAALGEGPIELDAQLMPVDLSRLNEVLGPLGMELRTEAGQAIELRGLVAGGVTLDGSWRRPEIGAEVSIDGFRLPTNDPRTPPLLPGPMNLDLGLRYVDGSARVERLDARSPNFSLSGDGAWQGALDLVALSEGGPLPDGALDARVRLDAPSLAFLAAAPGIRRISGRAQAEAQLSGPLSAPVVEARWELHEGAVRVDDVNVAGMERLEFAGSFDGKVIELARCTGELGAAPFAAAGSVDLAAEGGPRLNVRLNGRDLLLFRQQGVKVRADTGLWIHGPLDRLIVSGDISLTDGRYTKPVDFFMPLLRRGTPPTADTGGLDLFSLQPPLDTMQFDLRVKPGSGFRIKTNVADGMIRPDVRLTGTGEVPYLLGDVYFDRTYLSLPALRVTVEQGVVRFQEDNPFEPTLDIRIGYRRYGYDVTILITGSLSEPTVTLSSVPPLEPDELLLMTTTGQPPKEAASAEEALGTVAVYLARDWLLRLFGDLSTEEEEGLLDRIEIEFGRDATNQGAETIEGRFLLDREVLRENDALFLTGERDAYGDFNLGLRIRFLFP